MKRKKLEKQIEKIQKQVKIIETQKSKNYNITKQVIQNKIDSNFDKYLQEYGKFREKYSGPMANNKAKKDFDETPKGKKYKKQIKNLKNEKAKITTATQKAETTPPQTQRPETPKQQSPPNTKQQSPPNTKPQSQPEPPKQQSPPTQNHKHKQ